jgi:hypothetical protein
MIHEVHLANVVVGQLEDQGIVSKNLLNCSSDKIISHDNLANSAKGIVHDILVEIQLL